MVKVDRPLLNPSSLGKNDNRQSLLCMAPIRMNFSHHGFVKQHPYPQGHSSNFSYQSRLTVIAQSTNFATSSSVHWLLGKWEMPIMVNDSVSSLSICSFSSCTNNKVCSLLSLCLWVIPCAISQCQIIERGNWPQRWECSKERKSDDTGR